MNFVWIQHDSIFLKTNPITTLNAFLAPRKYNQSNSYCLIYSSVLPLQPDLIYKSFY